MSELLHKSELNLDAAKYLRDGGHYATVCHPAYYSCLQLMKYKIKHNLHLDYEQQETELNSSSRYRGNSHNYLIYKVRDMIRQEKGEFEAREFESTIKALKSWREKSDYKPEAAFTRDKCDRAIITAENLTRTINNALP